MSARKVHRGIAGVPRCGLRPPFASYTLTTVGHQERVTCQRPGCQAGAR